MAAVFISLLVATAACGEDECERDVMSLKECHLKFAEDVCATPSGRCEAACIADTWCGELLRGARPPKLEQCLAHCIETLVCDDGETVIPAFWKCDGELDCVDGSDEHDACEYFHCRNGERIPQDGACDDVPQCSDGSDERHCRKVNCPGSKSIWEEQLCDGTEDCLAGFDERNCE